MTGAAATAFRLPFALAGAANRRRPKVCARSVGDTVAVASLASEAVRVRAEAIASAAA